MTCNKLQTLAERRPFDVWLPVYESLDIIQRCQLNISAQTHGDFN